MAAIQRNEGANGNNVTHLEFTQAMNDFKIMFPEVDEDVIEVVLRSNNGAVDPTIDHLLTMSVDSENEKIRKELDLSETHDEIPPRYSPATPPPTYQQAVPHMASPLKYLNSRATYSEKTLNLNDEKNLNYLPSNCASSSSFPSTKCSQSTSLLNNSLRYKFQWKPPIIGALPKNFLRIDVNDEPEHNLLNHHHQLQFHNRNAHHNYENNMNSNVLTSALLQQKMEENERQRKLSQSGIGPDLLRYLEDERFAILLQNEEFVQELRRNKDFMSTLELDSNNQNTNLNSCEVDGYNSTLHSDSDAFKETLRNMGKASRRKFAQLAKLFSRRKRRSFQQLLGGNHSENGNPSRDNLLNFDDNYTEFENEDASDNEQQQQKQQLHLHSDLSTQVKTSTSSTATINSWTNHLVEDTNQMNSRNVKT